jgi:hypothetical protein
VWETIQSLTLQGTAYPNIVGFACMCDGRAAIQTLIGQYEGTAAMSRTKQASYDKAHNAVYTGEKRNFIFENFIDKHTKAYKTLFEACEDKKVDDFLRGLGNPSIRMNFAETLVYGNSDLRKNYMAFKEYLSLFVANASSTQNRSISALEGSKLYGGGRGRGSCRGYNGGRNTYGHRGHGYCRGQGGGRG